MKKFLLVLASIFAISACFSVTSSAAVGDNLCADAEVIDYSGAVGASDEQIDSLTDGNIDTKWCSTGMSTDDPYLTEQGVENWVVFDFGESKYFNRYQIFHASLCKRDFGGTSYDTKSWIVEVSDDLVEWTEVSRVTDNTANFNDVEIDLVCARYLRLLIVEPTQEPSTVARISEFKVIESDNGGTVSEDSAADALAEMEAARKAADLEARMSLLGPAIIYWGCSAVAGFLVYLLVRYLKKKNA